MSIEWNVPEEYIGGMLLVSLESQMALPSSAPKGSPPAFLTMNGRMLSQTPNTLVLRMDDAELVIPKHRIMYVAKASDVALASAGKPRVTLS